MKRFFAFGIIVLSAALAFGQNEQSPIVEKEIAYKNWTYKNVQDGGETSLRDFAAGKKLVMVVYFAPWCGNWKFDAPFVQKMFDKYKANGFDVIAVGEYDPVDAIKTHIKSMKLTFPVVWESDARTAKQYTLHYQYRKSTGDTRNWGSPWYIFLEPASLEKKGDILLKKANIINGEIIEAEGEKFIRQKLGLPAEEGKAAIAEKNDIEACNPEKKETTILKKP